MDGFAAAGRATLPLDQIIQGNCIAAMERLPAASVDLIFADPPYNLQLSGELTRPTQTVVDAVDEDWDRFDSFADYDAFTHDWLKACQRLLKPTGTLWVIGTYHNIFRVGTQLLDLGYWILNDVVWHKTNPMPNFRGTRFQNATETLIWAKARRDKSRYTFNYHAMKQLNDGLQMQNVWHLPHVMGEEKLKAEGKRVHPTQKPEALLYRVINAASNPGDVVLDPFFGTGTTGVVAKRLSRRFVGIEIDAGYVALARERIDAVRPIEVGRELLVTPSRRAQPKVAFGLLVENGRVEPGTVLTSRNGRHRALVRADGQLESGDHRGSIHRVGALVQELPGCNGWDFWHVAGADGALLPLDALRQEYLSAAQLGPAPANGAAEGVGGVQVPLPL